MIYQAIRELVRLSSYVFFRRIDVVGSEHIPQEGATIFFGNHPNSLLDPALITAFGERKIHFAAKDTLFQNRWVASLFRQLGVVPIRRRRDHPDGPLDNQAAFQALYELLDRGDAMGIFPEGISHNGVQLAELKTGAARIALEMSSRGVEVKLIPCGLTYLRRDRFRSSVLIQFGEPLCIPSRADESLSEVLSPRALTDEMELSLRGLTINAESWEDLSLLDAVRRIYQPPRIKLEERAELARRFNEHYPALRDAPDVVALSEEVSSYREDLYALGLRDRDISGSLSAGRLLLRLARHIALSVLWLPLALLGAPLHLPFAISLGWGSRRIAPRKDVIATTKFLVGALSLLGIYLASAPLAWSVGAGWWSALAPLTLALSGWGTLKVAERGRALWRTLWVWSRCLRARSTLRGLRAQRRALHHQVLEVVNAHLPEGLERLFYQDPNVKSALTSEGDHLEEHQSPR